MTIHPQYILKDGIKQFVVLPYEEFLRIHELLEEYERSRTVREEKLGILGDQVRSVEEILGDFR